MINTSAITISLKRNIGGIVDYQALQVTSSPLRVLAAPECWRWTARLDHPVGVLLVPLQALVLG